MTTAANDDLTALAGVVAAADAAALPPTDNPVEQGAPAAAGGVVAAAINPVEELATVIFAAGQLGGMLYPSLREVYAKKRCDACAVDLYPAFEKLGWNVTGGDAMIYLNALGAAIILGLETRLAIMHDLAAQKPPAVPPGEATPETAPSGAATAPGAVVSPQMALYPVKK